MHHEIMLYMQKYSIGDICYFVCGRGAKYCSECACISADMSVCKGKGDTYT